jgi:putative transposase
MGHSFTSSLFHCVFSTKERRKTITSGLQESLWPYLGGICRNNEMKALVPSTLAPAKALQLIKANSSKWVHEEYSEHPAFAWQEGYGAFSIGKSQVDVTVTYIRNQPEHHQKQTFQEEVVAFLERHEIEYGPRFLWG